MSSGSLVQIASVGSNRRRLWPRFLRHAVMAFFFVFLLHVAYHHLIKGGGPRGAPSVEAYCPFGGLESLYQFLTTGGYIRRIEPSSMILFAALLLLTLLAGRGFCGWVCPFGAVQEWLGLLGRKLFGERYNPTGRWDRVLRNLKYLVLVVVIALTWRTGTLVFRAYDPFLAFFHLGTHWAELRWAYAILILVLLGSLFIERFFCKYGCPLGAVLAILSKATLSSLRRDPVSCKTCKLCAQNCHAHVNLLADVRIKDPECNYCMECVVACPKPNVLSVRGARVAFSHPLYATMLVGGLFLLIGTSKLAGKWETRPTKVTFTDARGNLSAESIRGWMTLEEVSRGYGVPLRQLYAAAGIPERVPPATPLNKVAAEYGVDFSPEKVRALIAAHLAGRPLEASIGQAPREAALQTARPALAGKAGKGASKTAKTGEVARHPPAASAEIRGYMTLNEIELNSGVPKGYLLKELGLPANINTRVPVREWLHDYGKTVADLREAVERYRSRKGSTSSGRDSQQARP